MDVDVKIQWDGYEQAWVAMFMRDGEPWFLGGALVGMDTTPQGAVQELLAVADHLVVEGHNFLTEGPIESADRQWLFRLLDRGNDAEAQGRRYAAARENGLTGTT